MFTSLYIFKNDIINLTTGRMLILHFENSTFGVIISWSGRVSILLVIGGRGSGWVGSHEMDSWIIAFCYADTLRHVDDECVVTVVMPDADVVDGCWWEETDWLKVWIVGDLFGTARRRQQLVDTSWRWLNQPTTHNHNVDHTVSDCKITNIHTTTNVSNNEF